MRRHPERSREQAGSPDGRELREGPALMLGPAPLGKQAWWADVSGPGVPVSPQVLPRLRLSLLAPPQGRGPHDSFWSVCSGPGPYIHHKDQHSHPVKSRETTCQGHKQGRPRSQGQVVLAGKSPAEPRSQTHTQRSPAHGPGSTDGPQGKQPSPAWAAQGTCLPLQARGPQGTAVHQAPKMLAPAPGPPHPA